MSETNGRYLHGPDVVEGEFWELPLEYPNQAPLFDDFLDLVEEFSQQQLPPFEVSQHYGLPIGLMIGITPDDLTYKPNFPARLIGAAVSGFVDGIGRALSGLL